MHIEEPSLSGGGSLVELAILSGLPPSRCRLTVKTDPMGVHGTRAHGFSFPFSKSYGLFDCHSLVMLSAVCTAQLRLTNAILHLLGLS